jgi:XTP/dITP diphosphohydrolase
MEKMILENVVLASSNRGKIFEISQMLKDRGIQIIPQTELGVTDIEETGTTFIENALLKAKHACEVTKLPAIADDSGLVVPALYGEPGIFSSRYAGLEANDVNNIEKLLAKLRSIAQDQRTAFYYCVMVFLRYAQDPCPIVCEGVWHGQILFAPQGTEGFGYDPVFYDVNYQRSAAELPLDVKNRISHRGQAMHKLMGLL